MWALQRTTDGKWVARPGLENSYTFKYEEMRFFTSREEAEKERCIDNERIVELR